ncbi:MAG: hypothetical protein ACHQYO_09325 [Halanaerobiales bacterium]
MVTVKNYHLREGEKGNYISLELTGEVELVQSANTGRFYATARKCFIFSTFDEAMAKTLVGKTLPGNIVRVSCDPYEYTVPESGEIITLSHSYGYLPDEKAASVQVQQLQPAEA